MRLIRGEGQAGQPAAPDPVSARPSRTGAALAIVGVLSIGLATIMALAVTGRPPFDRADGSTGADSAVPRSSSSQAPGDSSSAPALPADTDLAERFLTAYVDEDGRVVRRDQGGDTVSEGQAYAMLLAASDQDEESFDSVWTWTQDNLLRTDGLLSWTWRDGAIVDANSASDADLDAAHALVVAGDVFDRADLLADGKAMALSILDHETRTTPLGRVLVAGQWATAEPYQVNPSYGSPTAYQLLGEVTGDSRWAELAEGDRAVVDQLLEGSPLPPDWAQVKADGSVDPMPPPGGGDVDYGLDAQRISIRYAASCAPEDRDVASRIGASLKTVPAEVRGVYDLGGSPQVEWQHPVSLVSAAASTQASGQGGATESLLDAAATLDGRGTTYYGAAWAALGERFLREPASLGITCGAKEIP